MNDNELMRTLIGQVLCAVVASDKPMASERDVETFITRPMWDAFCREARIPVPSMPTAWKGVGKTIRVFGSETRVIESSEWWCISRPIQKSA